MKKLQPIQSLKSNETANNDSSSCTLGPGEARSCSSSAKLFEKKAIPIIQFNTKNLEGLETKLQNIKICNYQSDFVTEIQKILNLYSDDELKYNHKFVLFVMQEVERFILKKKSGENKKDLVIQVCQKYFNNDPDLVEMVIDLVFEKLSQVKFFKRQGLKLMRFFLKVMRSQQ